MAVYTQNILSPDPLYLQPKSYDARSDRKWFQDLASPGVVGSGDFLVTATSGNMVINYAAGIAWILGQNIADQGMYREYIVSAGSITVPGNASGNPRVDTVILRVMDNAADASTFNECRIEVVPGTPTVGATLANLSGIANLTTLGEASKSVLLLGYVLVPNGATVLTTAGNIRDARVRAFIGLGGMTLGKLWTFSATPPSSPVDGDVWVYNAISGNYWKFVYDSSESTYKWKFAGGPPIFAEVNGTASVSGTGYAAPPNGPDLTLARAGIYDIKVEFSLNSAGVSTPTYFSYALGGTGAQDVDAAVAGSGNSFAFATFSRQRRQVVTAGMTIGARYRVGLAGTNVVQNRTLYIQPTQVA